MKKKRWTYDAAFGMRKDTLTLIEIQLVAVIGAHGEQAAAIGEQKGGVGAAATHANHMLVWDVYLRRHQHVLLGSVAQSPLRTVAPDEYFATFGNDDHMFWTARERKYINAEAEVDNCEC